MNQTRRCLAAVVLTSLAVLLAGCPAGNTTEPIVEDPDESLDGVWEGMSWYEGAPASAFEDYVEKFSFSGSSYMFTATFDGQSAFIVGTFGTEAGDEVNKVDCVVTSSSAGATGLTRGVYKIEGSKLYIAFGGIGNDRAAAEKLDPAVGPVFVGEQVSGKGAKSGAMPSSPDGTGTGLLGGAF